nr:RNA-directed DNA polymerase, eukaryota [Tanacetum cinerariifolium]
MRKVSSWWNVDYTDVSSYEEWCVWLVSIRIPSKLKSMMEGVLYGLWWSIRNFRNKLLFDNKFYGLWWSIWNFKNKLLFNNKTPKKALSFDNPVSLSFNWYRIKISSCSLKDICLFDFKKPVYITIDAEALKAMIEFSTHTNHEPDDSWFQKLVGMLQAFNHPDTLLLKAESDK